MTFRLLPAAIDDLDAIDEWIVDRFGESAADKARSKLVGVFELLVKHPDIGVLKPEIAAAPMRFFAVGPNWIVYLPGDPLLIYRVYPAAKDLVALKL